MISAKPNRPIATLTTPRPSVSSGTPKAKRATPELTSVPTMPSRRPRTIIAIAFSSEPCASTTAPIRPSTISEKYSAGPNLSASSDSGVATVATKTVATRSGEERRERRGRQRGAGLTLARHLVTVEAGDRRRRLARHVEQDRRRRAAVLRAVVDAGQHDQRRDRLQRVGRRQQHRDGRDRADAGQHADQRAEQRADQRVEQIDRRQRDAEAQREVIEQLHRARSSANAGPDRQLELETDHEDRDGEHRERIPLIRASFGRNSRARGARDTMIRTIVDSASPTMLTIKPNSTTLPSTITMGRHCQPGSALPWSRSARSASDRAQDDQQDAEDAREIAGTHPRGGAQRVVRGDRRWRRCRTRRTAVRRRNPSDGE